MRLSICGRIIDAEVIELLGDFVLIQELISKNIYLIDCNCIEPEYEIGYNNNCEEKSNIISLEGWTRWRKRKKQPKQKRL